MARVNPQKIVNLAREYIGVPYKWGGTTPKGFDCSGLVQFVYAKAGIPLKRTTYQQITQGLPIPKGHLQPGDIVFFHNTSKGPAHEGLYIGGGKFIEAPHSGARVRISSLAGRRDYVGARRIIKGGTGFSAAVESAASDTPTPTASSPANAEGAAVNLPDYSQPLPVGGSGGGPPAVSLPGSGPSASSNYQPRQAQQTWQLIASQPGASKDTLDYASQLSG